MSKTMLITGGSRGIGAATARLAAERGYTVCLTYRQNQPAAEALVADITAAGGRAAAFRADVAELILFATSQATAASVLNDLGELVRAGRAFTAGDRVAVRNGDVHLLDFPGAEHWLYAADDLYRTPGGEPVRALLVVPVDDLVPTPGADRPCGRCS